VSGNDKDRTGQEALAAFVTQVKQFRLGGLRDLKSPFQRPLDYNRVKRIVDNWDNDLWKMPVVNVHPATVEMTLVDGQHGVNAACLRFGESALVDCRVTHVTHPGKLFIAVNTSSRRVSALDIFRALVDAGDVAATGTAALAEKHGFQVKHGSEARLINAAKILQLMHDLDSVALGKALETASALVTMHNNERGWANASVLHALTWFYRTTSVAPKDLIPRLDKYSPYSVIRHPVYDMMNVLDIAGIYNKGRHARNHVNPAESVLWKKGVRA
jgi:hypothetical protein